MANIVEMQIVIEFAKEKLRDQFDSGDYFQGIATIEQARTMGFDELADELDSDLKTDAEYSRQVLRESDSLIAEGATL